LDLHTGISKDPWSVRFTVRNLTDQYDLVDLYGGSSSSFDPAPSLATVLSGRVFALGVDRRL
jgi:outer membrane receptor protein involved in Fe transport